MTLEQLLFVAIFVLIPLINFLGGLLRKRRQRTVEPEVAHPSPVALLPTPPTDLGPLEVPRARPSAPPPGPVAPPIARRRAPRLRPADLRRGVVLMTILARCPGLEGPPGDGPSQGPVRAA